tara:strand:- start:102 stop:500 length:399 start_codon:yes stop_codon:yes gene_type:complete
MEFRTILRHEIMTKGGFYFELKDGTEIEVFGQRHTFVESTQYFQNGEWYDDDTEEIDDFHLTGYEEGYLYIENDLRELFNIEDYEWDYNGVGYDWCGIEEEDDDEVRQKKWDDYRSKFPRLTSKEQFDFLKP